MTPIRLLPLLAVVALATGVPAHAQAPPGAANAPPAPAAKGQWPVTLKETAPEADSTEGEVWNRAEVEAAQAQCKVILARIKAETRPLDPMRAGECGAPAPVEVVSVASVKLSQPATLNCEMLETLHTWLRSDVQPAARKLLGAPVKELDVLSSYSCRNAYGRKKTRLSEHARANAIDISGFDLGSTTVALLADWGMTERDVRARIRAAEAAAREHARKKAEAEALQRAEAKAKGLARKETTPSAGTPTSPPQRPVETATRTRSPVEEGDTGNGPLRSFVSDTFRRATQGAAGSVPSLTLEQPSRLGGPKEDKTEAKAKAAPAGGTPAPGGNADARKQFLHEIHVAACKRFGTVLGPEANEAHRNHFHLDMAERPRGNFCE